MKKRSLKTKLLALSVVLILAALSVYGTLAYFTAQGTARNAVTTGDIKIALEERMLTRTVEKTVPFENQLGVMPGSDVSKIVTVSNTGGQPAWVRVSLDKAIELARGVEGEADLSLVTCDLNTESWTERTAITIITPPWSRAIPRSRCSLRSTSPRP